MPVVVDGTRVPLKDGPEVSFVCTLSGHSGNPAVHAITAEGLAIGSLKWAARDGEVSGVHVHPDFRRRGVGRLLWQVAGSSPRRIASSSRMTMTTMRGGHRTTATTARGRATRSPVASAGHCLISSAAVAGVRCILTASRSPPSLPLTCV